MKPLELSWAREDQPAVKIQSDTRSVTDAELLSLFLVPEKNRDRVTAARELLFQHGGDLKALLSGLEHNQEMYSKYPCFNPDTLTRLRAAIELTRRFRSTPKSTISCSMDARDNFFGVFDGLPVEKFYILCLNRANKVISRDLVSTGGVSGTAVDAKVVFGIAIRKAATAIVLAHNHPSGNTNPSQADIELTKKLVEAGKVLDIMVLDHLIMTDTGYLSMIDEGFM